MIKFFRASAHVLVGMSFVVAGLILLAGIRPAQASFTVSRDGFSISNAPGYCFAMAAFSRWYYLNRAGYPPLRTALPNAIQTRIARDLQSFYSRHLVGVQADYCNRYSSDQTESFRRFVLGLMMGEPRIVLLMNKGKRGAVLHAVLAWDWIPERNVIRVYDPNYCNEERYIDLNSKEYTSLDITYSAICFPEVLDDHAALVSKMEALYSRYAAKLLASPPRTVRIQSQ
jgi:hypothetical protein